MALLVIDTALGACSVALFDNQILASRYVEMQRGHAEVLPRMVAEVLAEAAIETTGLTAIAVTMGPGTFTGLRIGLSFAIGMGLALGIPVKGIDSLTATAIPHLGSANKICVAQQAGATGKYYSFVVDGKTAAALSTMALRTAEGIQLLCIGETVVLVGDGADKIVEGNPEIVLAVTNLLPNASLFAEFAAALSVSADMPQPIYLRDPDAKPSAPSELATPIVRLATTEDLAALAIIHSESFAAAWDEASLLSSLSLPGTSAQIIELGGIAYGFLMLQQIGDEAEILTLCVSPNFRRQHFGDQLLREVLANPKNSKVFLEVAADNHGAMGLYSKHGFVQTGLRRGYYQHQGHDAVDAVLMTLHLKADLG